MNKYNIISWDPQQTITRNCLLEEQKHITIKKGHQSWNHVLQQFFYHSFKIQNPMIIILITDATVNHLLPDSWMIV